MFQCFQSIEELTIIFEIQDRQSNSLLWSKNTDNILEKKNFTQFNLGKSHKSFAPLGPCVVTLDEFDNPWDLEIRCELNNVVVQEARTSQLLNGVPTLISYLSGICELRPGDLIFTGTPSGVGLGRTPPQYLDAGDLLVSTITGIGSLENRCI